MDYQDKKLGRYLEGVVPTTKQFKRIKSRYSSVCFECGGPITRGEQIVYSRTTKTADHAACSRVFN